MSDYSTPRTMGDGWASLSAVLLPWNPAEVEAETCMAV